MSFPEIITFHRGLGYQSRSALMEAGFLKIANNITFRVDGKQELRPKFDAVNSTAVNAIHSINRFRNRLFIADGTHARERSALTSGDFTDLKTDLTNAIFTYAEYKEFLNAVNGTDNLLFDEYGNLYPGSVANPISVAVGAVGAAGNPNDTYVLYTTYYITWPNGHTYETGLSSASDDVVVANEKIEWSSIPICPYSAYKGTAPTIYRKLYRGPGTGGSLANIYLVTTIENNTTTTYSDNVTDSQLASNGASIVDDYLPAPSNIKYAAVNYGRFFYITTDNPHRLYYSDTAVGADAAENEILMPLAFPTNNWDDIRVPGYGKTDPQGLITWGIYLYIPMKQTWIRKYGDDPDTWSYKKTWATMGTSSPYSLTRSSSPPGILSISTPVGGVPGISLFNGQTSQIITGPQFNYIFEEDLNLDAIDKCRGTHDGRYYHLLYPSSGKTEPDKYVAFDISRYPEVRAANWNNLKGRSLDIYDQGSKIYVGGFDGILRESGSTTETIDVDVETHDIMGGDPKIANSEKRLKELKYNLDTGGKAVDLEIYIDGELTTYPDNEQKIGISGTGDYVQYKKSFPPNFVGYVFSFKVRGEGLSTFDLYSPWQAEFDVTV